MSQFKDIVDEILGSVLLSCGFVRVTQDRDLVTYQSSACSVNVGYDSQRSGEVFLGLIGHDKLRGPAFGFDEVIRAASVPAEACPSGYAARDEKSIRRLLQTMAKLLEAYCMPLLRGDESAWIRLEAQRNSDVDRYAVETSLRLALSRATEAWRAKDFAKVIELLGPVRHLLGAADQAKLEYAESKLGIT